MDAVHHRFCGDRVPVSDHGVQAAILCPGLIRGFFLGNDMRAGAHEPDDGQDVEGRTGFGLQSRPGGVIRIDPLRRSSVCSAGVIVHKFKRGNLRCMI